MSWQQVITLIVIPVLSALGAGGLIQVILKRGWDRQDRQREEEKEKEKHERNEDNRKIFKEEAAVIFEAIEKQGHQIQTLIDADKKHGASLVSVLRDRLQQLNRYCYKKGYTTQEERENFEEMYNSYKDLGGNGVMVNTHERFFKLPSQEEYEFKLRLNKEK